MSAKEIVQDFYKSDVILEAQKVNDFLHPEVILEWHSTKGFLKLNHEQLIGISNELGKTYVRSKYKISHLVEEGNTVAKLSKAHTVPDDAMSNDSSEECNKNSDGAEFSSEQQQNYADLIQKRNIHRKCAVQSINLLIDTYVGC